ncbi:MAG: glucose-6-phosphate isomerase [Nitrospirota bacterium]
MDWRDEAWRAGMRITLDYNFATSGFIGENGVSGKEIDALLPKAQEAHESLARGRNDGSYPFFNLPYQDTSLIRLLADDIAKWAENFVLLGIGGSALGPIALHTALNHPYHNLLTSKGRGKRPRMFFMDNVDPDGFGDLLAQLNPAKTMFCVVTKSGGTAETMAQFMVVRTLMQKALGKRAMKEHFVCITDPEKGNLRKIVQSERFTAIEVPPGVGGRFSVFTAVGLLPAAVSGIEIDELLAGAADMDKRTSQRNSLENPAHMAAMLQYIADKKGKNISVMMPYSSALRDIADWYRQIWAESLGKKLDLKGNIVHTGQTPVKALGTTDQHSQVQLYMEGPNDKTFIFLRVENFKRELPIPKIYKDIDGIAYLGGHSMAELINAEQAATEAALGKAGRPSMTIRIPEVRPFTVGQVLYLLEVSTALAGGLYGINPFDQPGVEEGKLLTYAMMGRPGFEGKRAELEKLKKRPEYVI